MSIADKLQTILENEQKVYNAGYEKGKSEGGSGEKPTLFTPSISLQSVTSVLTITDDNGGFVQGYNIYANDNLITVSTSKEVTLSDYIEHTGTLNIKVQAFGANFNSSDYAVTTWEYVNADGTLGLAYTLSSDRTYATCTGIGTATDTDIAIAGLYEGIIVTTIGDHAFSNNTKMTSVAIPSSITNMRARAFYQCGGLNAVYISNISVWCSISFSDLWANPLNYAKKLYLNGTLVEELEIPNGVIKIAKSTFIECTSLTSVVIPDTVTSIEEQAFYDCSNVASITLSNSTLSIGVNAFRYCSSLSSIVIPSSVNLIGNYAFGNCSSLLKVDFSTHTTIPTLGGSSVFSATHEELQIKVPANLIDEWKAATNWSDYASKIVTEFTNTL